MKRIPRIRRTRYPSRSWSQQKEKREASKKVPSSKRYKTIDLERLMTLEENRDSFMRLKTLIKSRFGREKQNNGTNYVYARRAMKKRKHNRNWFVEGKKQSRNNAMRTSRTRKRQKKVQFRTLCNWVKQSRWKFFNNSLPTINRILISWMTFDLLFM